LGGSSPWGEGGGNLQTDAAQLFLFVPIPAKAEKLGLLSIYKFSLMGCILRSLRPTEILVVQSSLALNAKNGFLKVKAPGGPLKVHKNENFFGFDFEFCPISLLVMHK
jgi:hypothetical protein